MSPAADASSRFRCSMMWMPALDEQDPVHGQDAVARPRDGSARTPWCPLPVVTDPGVGQPLAASVRGRPGRRPPGRGRSAGRRSAAPSRCGRARRRRAAARRPPGRAACRSVGRHAVAGGEDVDALGGGHVEEDAARDQERGVLGPERREAPAALGLGRVDAAVQQPVVADVGEGVDVRADVPAGHDDLVRRPSRRRGGPCRRAGGSASSGSPGGWASTACR